jgi:hypothetical protein
MGVRSPLHPPFEPQQGWRYIKEGPPILWACSIMAIIPDLHSGYKGSIPFRSTNLKDRIMIEVECDNCGEDINKKGAILWGPPNEEEMCKKTHLCRKCYKEIFKYIEG